MIGQSPLFSLWRDTYEEVVVHGEIVVSGKDRVLYRTSESIGAFSPRGLQDPWLLLAAELIPEHRGRPAVVLLTTDVARLYQQLASAEPHTATGHLRQVLLENPGWVGEATQLDAQLMLHNPGRLIAKAGEAGLLALAVLPTATAPQGLGIVLKLGAGHDHTAMGIALSPLLRHLDLRSPPALLPPGQTVRYHYQPFGHRGPQCIDISPRVSEQIAVWPGDVGYSRRISFDPQNNPHLLVSCIQTTVHVGAHADACNHFGHTPHGIDLVDLSKYVGACQVIEVNTARGSAIVPTDFAEIAIRANRVLFKTRSFPDPTHFNPDFNMLSVELVEYLAQHGVILVGLDTPSIDEFHSKELPAHHATARAGMAILEGVVLHDVLPGLYELIALPLKLADADASPVRAILRPL